MPIPSPINGKESQTSQVSYRYIGFDPWKKTVGNLTKEEANAHMVDLRIQRRLLRSRKKKKNSQR